ncbi:ankyrin repeat domain-containing protein 16 isoform X2 [Denticeps clupeoides]|uniref:Ankyrin repeat domain-containing protein 16 n=1 Tax=Denticeps clupeoides TaxID=299321 RepID=A0AAY4DXU7_9TELE|nr:ankyrin repeat domain-containing protein 16 isoform X2 [Denticeps clupeoides]
MAAAMSDERRLKILAKLAQDGDLLRLRRELDRGGGPERELARRRLGSSGDTLLHHAARGGHPETLRYLLDELGAPPELCNGDYKRALHEAAAAGHAGCVALLLRAGADVDSLKRADWTPLMMSCTRRNLQVIELLLEGGADPSLTNKDGWSAFHIACREGDSRVIQRLLLANADLWRTESKTRRTPLHTAAMHGCEDVVRILLDRGQYKTDMFDSCGVTPFMDALRQGHVSIAELLLNGHQASPVAADVLGLQPLHQVCITGQERALRYLVEVLGVNVNSKATDMQLTGLHYAAKEGHTGCVKTLVMLGVELDAKDRKGRSALHMASIGQRPETVAVLLTLGLEDSPDASGVTAAQLARTHLTQQAFQRQGPCPPSTSS